MASWVIVIYCYLSHIKNGGSYQDEWDHNYNFVSPIVIEVTRDDEGPPTCGQLSLTSHGLLTFFLMNLRFSKKGSTGRMGTN